MFEMLVRVSTGAVMMMRAHALKTIRRVSNSDNLLIGYDAFAAM